MRKVYVFVTAIIFCCAFFLVPKNNNSNFKTSMIPKEVNQVDKKFVDVVVKKRLNSPRIMSGDNIAALTVDESPELIAQRSLEDLTNVNESEYVSRVLADKNQLDASSPNDIIVAEEIRNANEVFLMPDNSMDLSQRDISSMSSIIEISRLNF